MRNPWKGLPQIRLMQMGALAVSLSVYIDLHEVEFPVRQKHPSRHAKAIFNELNSIEKSPGFLNLTVRIAAHPRFEFPVFTENP